MPKTKNAASGKYHLVIQSMPGYFLIFCLVVAFYFLFVILKPFITVLLVAAILATVFYPVHRRIRNKMPKCLRLSAFISCILVILIIVVPLVSFTFLLASEGVDTYTLIEQKVGDGDFDVYIEKFGDGKIFSDIKDWISPVVDLDSIDVKGNIIGTAQTVSTFLVGQTAMLLKNITSLLVSFFIMLFSMYYFFKDGELILKKIMHLSPLPTKYELEIVKKFNEVSKATIFGIFLAAVAQGLVGGIGFVIAGIHHAIFWGTAIALFSLVPLFGTAIIWVPAAIILLLMGSYFGGIFLIVWGVFAIGSVDNFLRPFLIEGKAKLYPLLTFLAIFGGLMVFGLKGVIFGPLVLAFCMTFVHIYELEYKKVIKH